MNRLELQEYESRVVEFPAETARLIEQNLHDVFDLNVTLEREQYRLRARNFVGTVVLPGLEIRIQPKCGTRSLFYLLTYAYKLAQLRREILPHGHVDDVREFLLSILASQIDDLLRSGLRAGYVEYRDRLSAIRGRLLLREMLVSRARHEVRVPCLFEEFTVDNPYNRVLRYALGALAPPRDPRTRLRLRRARRALSDVAHRRYSTGEIAGLHYDRLTSHYEPIHQLCRLLLDGSGIENTDGPFPLGTFLVDMNRVFEDFVAEWLRERVSAPLEVSTQHPGHLDRGRKLQIRPDLVLTHGGRPIVVADTKYKALDEDGRPSRADAYQALAYARSLRVRTALLIYASSASSRTFATIDGENALTTVGLDLQKPPPQIEAELTSLLGLMQENRLGSREAAPAANGE